MSTPSLLSMTSSQTSKQPLVAGIDIGGIAKGFHLVVLRGQEVICCMRSKDAESIAHQCRQMDVTLIGIDSPCMWPQPGSRRQAEMQLAAQRVSCFFTPSRQKALESTSGFYDWMFNGERVYQALAQTHPVLRQPRYESGQVCFETFPHAVTRALSGAEVTRASNKREQRRHLLEREGIKTDRLRSVDDLDAAVCALAATYLLDSHADAYGAAGCGYIFVPRAI